MRTAPKKPARRKRTATRPAKHDPARGTYYFFIAISFVIFAGYVVVIELTRTGAEYEAAWMHAAYGPQAVDVGGMRKYRDGERGFEIRYPAAWSVARTDSGVAFTRRDASRSEGASEFVFRSYANPDKLELESWYEDYAESAHLARPTLRSTTVVDRTISYFVERAGTAHYYVPKGDEVVELAYPVLAKEYLNTYAVMLESVKFTGERSAVVSLAR